MAKKKIEVINRTYLTPDEAHTIWNNSHVKDHSNLVVDFSLFHTNHCKVHPIDLLFDYIKKCAKEKDSLSVIFMSLLYLITLIMKKRKSRNQVTGQILFGRRFFIKQPIMNGKKLIITI